MLLLAAVALVMPAIFELVAGAGLPRPTDEAIDFPGDLEELSVGVSVVLLITYAANATGKQPVDLDITDLDAALSDPAAAIAYRAPSAWAISDLCATGFWSSVPPRNTPARTQAKTNNASRARTGGSNLLSRRKVSAKPLSRSATRCGTHHRLATASNLGGR